MTYTCLRGYCQSALTCAIVVVVAISTVLWLLLMQKCRGVLALNSSNTQAVRALQQCTILKEASLVTIFARPVAVIWVDVARLRTLGTCQLPCSLKTRRYSELTNIALPNQHQMAYTSGSPRLARGRSKAPTQATGCKESIFLHGK